MCGTLAALLPRSLRNIPDDQRMIEPTTVEDRFIVRHGVIPARFVSLFARDDDASASLQLQADIGPTQKLYTPEHVLRELGTWNDIFVHAMKHYLNQEEHEHNLPMVPNPIRRMKTALLTPSSIDYDDPRPIVTDGQYLDRIDRRRVATRVDFDDLDPDATDYQIVESAMYSLSYYLRKQLKAWYNQAELPIEFGYSVESLVEAKEREKQRLFGDVA